MLVHCIHTFKGKVVTLDNNKADFNILIRSIIVTEDKIHVHAGGGIVSDSDPVKELDETKNKIEKILTSFTS